MPESMACGTPVLALRKEAAPEIINPGVNGLYADRPEDLTILVRRLTELDRLKVRRSVAQVSYHRMVADYLALYREILDRSGEVQAIRTSRPDAPVSRRAHLLDSKLLLTATQAAAALRSFNCRVSVSRMQRTTPYPRS